LLRVERAALSPRPDIAEFLELIYSECNRKKRLERDPLAIVVRYDRISDREIVGLLCSTLAFGSVDLILGACGKVLEPLGTHPSETLEAMSDDDLRRIWNAFQYRFCFARDIVALFRAIRDARRIHGSLEKLFLAGDRDGGSMTSALGAFVRELRVLGTDTSSLPHATIRKNLLPDPADGSACKRLFLFLRWMVRKDDIDPGGWESILPSRLIVPLDVHMVRTCRDRLGFLGQARASASPNLKDALEATRQFALYSPDDPVKYDFALTRPGIDPQPGDEVFGCS
jgi:uncharacterized protein (TIGR02757 family)